MSERPVKSWRREIVSITVWALLLLLLTNVGWSVWFAQYGRMNGELMMMLEAEPAPESFGVSLDPSDSEALNLAYRRVLDVQTRYWLFRSPNEDHLSAEQVVSQREGRIGSFEAVAPRWLRRRHAAYSGLATGEDDYAGEVSVTIGWPFRLLWCAWRQEGVDFYITPGTGISIQEPSGPVGGGFLKLKECYSRALPYRPVLTGQLINGAMCAGIVLLVRQGLGAARRLRRRRAGRCTNCAYDLRGNSTGVCPECGAARERR